MYAQVEKSNENKSKAVANSVAPKQSNGRAGLGFVENRSTSGVQKKIPEMANYSLQLKRLESVQEMADNSPQTKLARQLRRMIDSHYEKQQDKVVQRFIKLDSKNVDLASLLSQANDVNERIILANWGWSKTEHNFTSSRKESAQEKLTKAIQSAKSQAIDVPALYSASNIKFLTKASGRLPTLYFQSGNESGRIRQQHGSGPEVISQSNKIDYFFSDDSKMNSFDATARQAMKNKTDFIPDLSTYDAKLTPTANYFHYEVTYEGGQKIAKIHLSGGTVDLDISSYDETKIKSVYQKVIGYTT